MGNNACADCGSRDSREIFRFLGIMSGTAKNRPVPGGSNYTRVHSGECVHIIIVALDYQKSLHPVTCTNDGANFRELAIASGHSEIYCLYNEDARSENVAALIAKVGSKCAPEDYFVFYYSGRGSQVRNYAGDETDGLSGCFCLMDEDGQVSLSTIMTDDEFTQLVVQHVPQKTRTLIIADCCHSGTLADLEKPMWYGREACSISGCLDSQSGIMTHAMLLAVGQLKSMLRYGYSVADLYNMILEQDKLFFKSERDILLQCPPSFTPDRIAWPFIPTRFYEAPYSRNYETSTTAHNKTTTVIPGTQDHDDNVIHETNTKTANQRVVIADTLDDDANNDDPGE